MIEANDFAGCLRVGKVVEAAVSRLCRDKGWGFIPGFGAVKILIDGKYHRVRIEYRNTPFRNAPRYVGLHPGMAIPINIDRINSIQGDCIFFIVVDYRPEHDTAGVFTITRSRVLELMKLYPDRVHRYENRPQADQSKESFYISIVECKKLDDSYFETIDRVITHWRDQTRKENSNVEEHHSGRVRDSNSRRRDDHAGSVDKTIAAGKLGERGAETNRTMQGL